MVKSMDEKPLVSVIIPVYKVEDYLINTIESVIQQTYRNIEIILVDDGSPDNSPKICDDFRERDDRVRVIHQENAGPSAARNAGIDIAGGEYIFFVDGDDIIMPHTIEYLVGIALRYHVKLVTYGLTSSYEEACKEDLKQYKLTKYSVREALINPNIATISPCNKLYHKDIWKKLRFPVGMFHEDEYVYHYVIDNAGTFISIDLKLYYYIQREGSTMHRIWKQRVLDGVTAYRDRIEFVKKYSDDELTETVLHELLTYLMKMYGIIYELDERNVEGLYFSEIQKLARELFENIELKKTQKIEQIFLDNNPDKYLQYYVVNRRKRNVRKFLGRIKHFVVNVGKNG